MRCERGELNSGHAVQPIGVVKKSAGRSVIDNAVIGLGGRRAGVERASRQSARSKRGENRVLQLHRVINGNKVRNCVNIC
jgi:hypothetical protein